MSESKLGSALRYLFGSLVAHRWHSMETPKIDNPAEKREDSSVEPLWRNGRRSGLKIYRSSSPTHSAADNNCANSVSADKTGSASAGFPVSCAGCGKMYTVARIRRDRCENHLCVLCRAIKGRARLAKTFTTPDSTKSQRIRAIGLVNKRQKLGWFEVPTRCMKCRKALRLDKHHPDYSRPGEVLFLCRSCHQRAHLSPNSIKGIAPIQTGENRPRKARSFSAAAAIGREQGVAS